METHHFHNNDNNNNKTIIMINTYKEFTIASNHPYKYFTYLIQASQQHYGGRSTH